VRTNTDPLEPVALDPPDSVNEPPDPP